jgi:septal ring factor EnvC (AmiA/AmiB activator)
MLRRISLILFLLCVFSFSYGQSSTAVNKLKNERKEILRQIKVTAASLELANTKKQSSLSKLNALNQLIYARKAYKRSLNKEIDYLNKETSELSDIIGSMESDLEILRTDYAEMVYLASKTKNNASKLTLLLTSKSYNELSTRLKIISQFNEVRQAQVKKIQQVKEGLIKRNSELAITIEDKEKAKLKLSREENKLAVLKTKQNGVISGLKSEEGNIRKKLKQLEGRQKKLNNLIKRKIQEEIDRQNRENEQTKYKNREGDRINSKNFELNKGKLPWPIVKCFVAGKFGKQLHTYLKGVYINNKGLKLQTPTPNAPVRAVFDGDVAVVAAIPGVGKVVMIKHGIYYTVYSGLSEVSVVKGDHVSTKQNIGKVRENADGAYELDFQVWKSKDPQNPQYWLYRY